jgi:hypothetical protein
MNGRISSFSLGFRSHQNRESFVNIIKHNCAVKTVLKDRICKNKITGRLPMN